MSPRRITLDPDRPAASLREAAGVTQAEAARLRGVAPPSQHQVEHAADRLEIRTLRGLAEALGYEVTITAAARKRGRCVSPNHKRGAPVVDPWTCQCGRTCCAECEGGTEDHLCDVCHPVDALIDQVNAIAKAATVRG